MITVELYYLSLKSILWSSLTNVNGHDGGCKDHFDDGRTSHKHYICRVPLQRVNAYVVWDNLSCKTLSHSVHRWKREAWNPAGISLHTVSAFDELPVSTPWGIIVHSGNTWTGTGILNVFFDVKPDVICVSMIFRNPSIWKVAPPCGSVDVPQA